MSLQFPARLSAAALDALGDEAAQRHGRQRQAGNKEPSGGARQDGVRHCVSGQAHAPQHQEDADRA